MTPFDGLVLLILAGILFFEARQEAGRALLDTLATILALHVTAASAAPLTGLLGWRVMPDTEVSPALFGLLFALLWGLGMLLSRYLHSRTRWSMDHLDPVFGFGFGLVIAVAVGHTFTDTAARVALLHHGTLPPYLAQSCLVEELGSFRSYHYVLNAFQAQQNGE